MRPAANTKPRTRNSNRYCWLPEADTDLGWRSRGLCGFFRLRRLDHLDALDRDETSAAEAIDAGPWPLPIGQHGAAFAAGFRTDFDIAGKARALRDIALGHGERDAATDGRARLRAGAIEGAIADDAESLLPAPSVCGVCCGSGVGCGGGSAAGAATRVAAQDPSAPIRSSGVMARATLVRSLAGELGPIGSGENIRQLAGRRSRRRFIGRRRTAGQCASRSQSQDGARGRTAAMTSKAMDRWPQKQALSPDCQTRSLLTNF